jgi:hypothetical protein
VGSLYLFKKNKMPTDITINNITGLAPFDIYLCDNPITTCIYIDTISSTPYIFEIPSIMSSQTDFNLKIVDDNSCTILETLSLP